MTGQSSPSPETGSERNEYVLASMPNACAREHEPGRVCIRPDGHAPDTGTHRHADGSLCDYDHRGEDPQDITPVLVLPLDGLREQIARTIDRADDKWQHGIGASGYDPNGPPLWLADAVLALLAGFAAGQGTT